MLGRNDPCPRIRPRPCAPPAGTQPDGLATAHGKCLRCRARAAALGLFQQPRVWERHWSNWVRLRCRS